MSRIFIDIEVAGGICSLSFNNLSKQSVSIKIQFLKVIRTCRPLNAPPIINMQSSTAGEQSD